MLSNQLTEKKCIPCEGGISPLPASEISRLLMQLKDWELIADKKIKKEFHFVNFKHTMDFVHKIAALAEEEGHHPDIFISYGTLVLHVWTYAAGGLTENDFILAAKIDLL